MTPARPDPPRIRWLKRLLPLAVLYVLLLLGVRLWWGWEAQRRFDAVVAKYRAAGIPVLWEDFRNNDRRGGAAAETGAQTLARVIAEVTSPRFPTARVTSHATACDEAGALLQVGDELAAARRILREAFAHPDRVTRTPLPHPLDPSRIVNLGRAWDLPQTLAQLAIVLHETGDDAAAVACLESLSGFGLALRHAEGVLLHALFDDQAHDEMAVAISVLAPDLRIAAAASQDASGARPARRDAVRRLIEALIDDGPSRENFARSFCVENLGVLGLLPPRADGSTPSGVAEVVPNFRGGLQLTLVAPLAQLAVADLVEYNCGHSVAAAAPDWPTVLARSPAALTFSPSPLHRASRFFQMLLVPNWGSIMMRHTQALARRRMAAVALAIRTYELDHGRLPAGLDTLVPDYLPVVPSDPFQIGNAPLGYLPHASPPLLYCVNSDGLDDLGNAAVPPVAVSRDSPDLGFPLRPVPGVGPGSGKP